MKKLQYFFIMMTLVTTGISNLGAMEVEEVKQAKTTKNLGDEKTSIFSIDAINKRLSALKIKNTCFCIQSCPSDMNPNATCFFLKDTRTKDNRKTTSRGSITYSREKDNTGKVEKINIGWVEIDDEFQGLYLACLLSLVALHDAFIKSHCSYVTVDAIADESFGLYTKHFDFEDNNDLAELVLKKLPDFLKNKGPELLKKIFAKLEDAADK